MFFPLLALLSSISAFAIPTPDYRAKCVPVVQETELLYLVVEWTHGEFHLRASSALDEKEHDLPILKQDLERMHDFGYAKLQIWERPTHAISLIVIHRQNSTHAGLLHGGRDFENHEPNGEIEFLTCTDLE